MRRNGETDIKTSRSICSIDIPTRTVLRIACGVSQTLFDNCSPSERTQRVTSPSSATHGLRRPSDIYGGTFVAVAPVHVDSETAGIHTRKARLDQISSTDPAGV